MSAPRAAPAPPPPPPARPSQRDQDQQEPGRHPASDVPPHGRGTPRTRERGGLVQRLDPGPPPPDDALQRPPVGVGGRGAGNGDPVPLPRRGRAVVRRPRPAGPRGRQLRLLDELNPPPQDFRRGFPRFGAPPPRRTGCFLVVFVVGFRSGRFFF